MSRSPVLAVDIGGTKLAAALGLPDGRVIRAVEMETPVGGSAEVVFDALGRLIDRVLDGRRVSRVGVGCGGPMRWAEGLVSPLHIPGWRDFPLRERLAERLSGASVRLHNDAVAVAVGEHWAGAGRASAALLGVVVSTGVGAGLLLGGRVVSGPTGNAGHLGHVVVRSGGPACACGGRGCVEAIARGPAIAEWAVAHGWAGVPTAAAVAAAARLGDPVARAALARSGRAVGVALASAAALLDLDVVVVGGGVSGAGEPFFTPLREAFARHGRVSLGRTAGLVGAAGFWLGGEGYWSAGTAAAG
jgi:glucokinase